MRKLMPREMNQLNEYNITGISNYYYYNHSFSSIVKNLSLDSYISLNHHMKLQNGYPGKLHRVLKVSWLMGGRIVF